jgi:hypothetical protein
VQRPNKGGDSGRISPLALFVLACSFMASELLTQSAWWSTNVLEGLLLFRAVWGRYWRKYPVFYFYVSYVLFESLLRFYFYVFKPNLFSSVYWSTQFVSVTIGYCIIWEIFCQVLAGYPGTARVARICLITIFLLVLSKTLLSALGGSAPSLLKTLPDLERYLRVVQAALLVMIVGLLAYYVIPTGRNIKGMILGYGLFVGLTLMHLALRSYLGDAFQPVWQHLGWVSYSAALIIWCSTLWSYHPSPQPSPEVELDRDYQRLALRTAGILAQVRADLVRMIRP